MSIKYIMGGRQSGKSTLLLKECLKQNGIFVVRNEYEKQRILHLLKKPNDLNIITLSKLYNSKGIGMIGNNIYVDCTNDIIEHYLMSHFNHIGNVTATLNEENIIRPPLTLGDTFNMI